MTSPSFFNDTTAMSYDYFSARILDMFPNALISEGPDGEIIVSTGYKTNPEDFSIIPMTDEEL